MRFEKWTIALAAAGVVSLVSAAKAEEKQSSVLSALSSTTLSGYVDTSAQWNFGTGDANLPPYRFGGTDKADGFNLDVVQLRIEKPLDEAQWAAGYRVDLWMGPDANSLGTQSILSSGASDFAIRQAYVALRMPVGNGIDWKVGVFDSILGYESVESPSNPNYTRSYGNTIEPISHTGILGSYRINDLISFSAGIANTVGPQINDRAFAPTQDPSVAKAESYKTYMGSITITAPESMGFLAGSTLYGGVVNGFSSSYAKNQTSTYIGATLATPVKGLRFGAALDLLDVHGTSGETWTIGGYGSYQATEKLSFHVRAEYLTDKGEQKFFVATYDNNGTLDTYATSPNNVLAVTATMQYDLWKNVLSRLELRWDHAVEGPALYGGTTVNGDMMASNPDYGTMENAWMLAANIIYKF
jgi:hypothetical protein